MKPVLLLALIFFMLSAASLCRSQDLSPIKDCHVWLPMTGVNDAQMEEARAAGYDTIMLKVHPGLVKNRREIDFTSTDERVKQAKEKGFKVLMPVLGWVGLGDGLFWDTDENGNKIPNQLDPFWPEAMEQVEWYYGQVIEHYKSDPRVVAFAPTWGIYGEAGFTSFEAGRSPHALARFNEWRQKQGLDTLDSLPNRKQGPNTEFNRFIRFRYLYIEEQFDAMIKRLKQKAGPLPVGMWQELYPVIGYLWNMVEVPSADFALYESCFTFQTNHHPEKSLGETMGFRYRCSSPDQYRDYYLPNLARKRGEGQRFMGCQLTNDYAVQSYKWTMEQAEKAQFDRYEDEFSPYLKKLLDEPLESPERDVLLVFPTYASVALSDHPSHGCDAMLIDVLLRMYGCQIERYASPRLDKLSVKEMDRFKLIIIPDAAFILSSTLEKLSKTKATILMTGSFAQSLDGVLVPFDQTREVQEMNLRYIVRPAGEVWVESDGVLTKGLSNILQKRPVRLDSDEAFDYESRPKGVQVLLDSNEKPLLSTTRGGRTLFLHGHIFAAACHNPNRVPPQLSGSSDASANEVDMWWLYDSNSRRNELTTALMKNILDYAGVDYRVRFPLPRAIAPYLGDHMEQASISANIAYNTTSRPQQLTVRTPFKPLGYDSRVVDGRYETDLVVPAFGYIALRKEK